MKADVLGYLSESVADNGLVVFRYRSFELAREVKKKVRLAAEVRGETYVSAGIEDLIARWSDPDLFPTSVVCDLNDGRGAGHRANVSMLSSYFSIVPGRRTTILWPARHWLEGSHELEASSTVLFVDERELSKESLAGYLRFLTRAVGVKAGEVLLQDERFLLKFEKDVLDGALGNLDDLRKELVREIALNFDTVSGIYSPSVQKNSAAQERSEIVRAIRSLIAQQNESRMSFVHAVALKQARGRTNDEIKAELCRATIAILSGEGVEASSNSEALIWAVLLCLCSSERSMDKRREEGVSVAWADQLARSYNQSLDVLHGDPFEGQWHRLVQLARFANQYQCNGEVPKYVQLLEQVKGLARSDPSAWTQRILWLLSSPPVENLAVSVVTGEAEVLPLSRVIGHDAAVDALRVRFEKNLHAVPLLISGPKGVGKRTLARGYAKTLLCEGQYRGTDPCDVCSACSTFSNGSLGYSEFDLARLREIDIQNAQPIGTEARKQVQGLRNRPLMKHRVLVINNADIGAHDLDVFLKSLEKDDPETTVILTATDVRRVRASALSRCWDLRLFPLNAVDSAALVSRWVGEAAYSPQVLTLIAQSCVGLPSKLSAAVRRIQMQEAPSLEDAKAALGLDWGAEVLSSWSAILAHDDLAPIGWADAGSAIAGVQHLRRFKATLSIIRPGADDAPCAPGVFLGLEAQVCQVVGDLTACATKLDLDVNELWCSLAVEWARDAWSSDGDLESLIDLTRSIVSVRL